MYGQHVAETALIDDGDGGILAERAAELMNVAVERIAVAWLVTLPYGYHQLGSINCFPDICSQAFENPGLEVGEFCTSFSY